MGIEIIDGFDLFAETAIDSRFVKDNTTERDAISWKYDGLEVLVLTPRKKWRWNGTTWDDITDADGADGADGTDGTNFLSGNGVPSSGEGADGDTYLMY